MTIGTRVKVSDEAIARCYLGGYAWDGIGVIKKVFIFKWVKRVAVRFVTPEGNVIRQWFDVKDVTAIEEPPKERR